MNTTVIFAGGSGNRMNSKARPKQFLQFYGKELIVHTIENFQNHRDIDCIVVACKEDWIDYMQQLVHKYDLTKVSAVVAGGETGQMSIYNGLVAIEKIVSVYPRSVVLIHDGVRPFVDESLISSCIESVKQHGSAITVVPATETIVTTEGNQIKTITDRSKCYLAKAPQCFYLDEILAAHRKAQQEGNINMIDSASLMLHYGHTLYTVQGNFDNIKITTPADFYTFRALYEVRENQQIFGL